MINQILIYTRPWEVRFGIILAEEFEKHYPDIPIRFVTFFTHCRAIIQSDSHYEVIFLPELLREVTGEELSGKEITEIDGVLYKRLELILI